MGGGAPPKTRGRPHETGVFLSESATLLRDFETVAHVENIPQQDSAERAFNKLARTFASQVEALKRYRTGGEQKVTVEHVTVNEGGQAIVGNVSHGGRGSSKNKGATS